mgnify:CR=1 FL=1
MYALPMQSRIIIASKGVVKTLTSTQSAGFLYLLFAIIATRMYIPMYAPNTAMEKKNNIIIMKSKLLSLESDNMSVRHV